MRHEAQEDRCVPGDVGINPGKVLRACGRDLRETSEIEVSELLCLCTPGSDVPPRPGLDEGMGSQGPPMGDRIAEGAIGDCNCALRAERCMEEREVVA